MPHSNLHAVHSLANFMKGIRHVPSNMVAAECSHTLKLHATAASVPDHSAAEELSSFEGNLTDCHKRS